MRRSLPADVERVVLDRELEEPNRTVFQSVDLNRNGVLSEREVDLFRQDAMISQNYDDDGAIPPRNIQGGRWAGTILLRREVLLISTGKPVNVFSTHETPTTMEFSTKINKHCHKQNIFTSQLITATCLRISRHLNQLEGSQQK